MGGALFFEDAPETTADGILGKDDILAQWGGFDRTDWFVASHEVKNPAYFWKVIVRAAQGDEKQHNQAFWMPNHESATARNVNKYLVSIKTLEANLAAWGSPEDFNFTPEEKEVTPETVWADPQGCNRQ